MASNTVASYDAVLKTQWPQSKVANLANLRNTLLQRTKRDETVGKNFVLALQHGNGAGGGSASFAKANANKSAMKYGGFLIAPTPLYQVATIDGQALRIGRQGPKSAVLDTFDATMKGGSAALGRSAGWMLFGNGGGSRGVAKSHSGVSLTLTNADDCVNFEEDMVIGTSSTDGTSGALDTGTVTIVGVDVENGILTASANWTSITGFADGHFLFRDGDFGAVPVGLAGWLPKVAPQPGDPLFFTVDRSVNPTRLAGIRYSNPGLPFDQALQQAMARVARAGGMVDLIVMNPMDIVVLTIAQMSKVVISAADLKKNPDIGMDSVWIISPMGRTEVIPDLNCPIGVAYGLTMDAWKLYSNGPALGYLDDDGIGKILREGGADQYTMRLGGYMAPGLDAPGYCFRAQLI